MIRKLVITALFLFGLFIFLYPTVMKFYHNYTMSRQSDAISEQFQVSSEDQRTAYQNFTHYNESLSGTSSIDSPPVVVKKDHTARMYEDMENVVATIDIPALDIHYPVFEKATPENLDRGVARVEGTSYPVGGKPSNSVLAAHSYSSDYEWFTHIDKLQDDAIVIINNFEDTLYYKVSGREIISPDEVDKLAIREDEDMITLLTCTASGEDRVLVYAERTSPPSIEMIQDTVASSKSNSEIKEDRQWKEHIKVMSSSSGIVAIALILIALFLLFMKRRK
ncbi:class C sortase [Salinicoccus hispanicus]|uniref:Class C sortase n=1 Tax=Salinicoccus hispanicus TaxID=157225 RepID=A0A6N8U0Z6_9STAP|nr:class C sortase [Salinicoccus hispanicus]MXQ51413.1 class C sortase [Salinicoccus hispanicus]